MITEDKLRSRVSKRVLILNCILFAILVVAYIFRGFTPEQFSVLLGLLMPVTLVYASALVKYIVENRYIEKNNDTTQEKQLTKIYISLTNWMIPLHFIILLLAIILFALGGSIITFGDLKLVFIFIESTFAVYVGLIINSLFKEKNPTTQPWASHFKWAAQ